MVRRRGCCLLSISISLAFFFFVLLQACEAQSYCNSSSWGNILNISYPFRLSSDPPNCGELRYELSCDQNNRTVLNLYSGKYYVEEISYKNRSMRVVDSGLQIQNCSSVPLYSLTSIGNFTLTDPFFYPRFPQFETYIVFLSCENPILITPNSPQFVNTSPCINGSSSSSSGSQYSYVFMGNLAFSDIPESCTVDTMVPIRLQKAGYRSFSEIHHEMALGFELSWYQIDCGNCIKRGLPCYPSQDPSIAYTSVRKNVLFWVLYI
ncbi:LEAF RUST 10 DISEASE-RESISTANCE LOCUS RECEPTOR-LIKE PROTEIN KINASE-like 2.8 [Telopea speciosissima]|uniref:LEAF RUST 10 DISEASE-RESISTANCE LOCUS RECEPTOR-LIKE PROTEIN KINASE-like 2.8 n=1 Tax=Telopea speciosissima TaxID=54955 RepID=UPI001CC38F33|nr:LEAF RUST 10 DISEASE-RESISTANCE LOCUS RECEPTOR-LIKE PROTEIN KINASE-like 2.8 [Telopea speciosissima]